MKGILDRIHAYKEPVDPLHLQPGATHAFCEPVYAGPLAPWHIRPLTVKGPKFGGGADTLALCDREVAWDLNVNITEHHLGHSCKACVEAFRKLIP